MQTTDSSLKNILKRALQEQELTREEIMTLLGISDQEQLQGLFQTARTLRQRYFGQEIFLYGFVYLSTYCRNDCRFCYYRRSNINSLRYRKTESEVLEAAADLAESGVHLIDLTMGEDPEYLDRGQEGIDRLAGLVRKVKARTGLPVMISPGVVPESALQDLARAGADWYACYQETHSALLFEELRINQRYAERLDTKYRAHDQGLLIEEGLLCGIGETDQDLFLSLRAMQELNADQVRVMNFIPQKGTPLEGVAGLGSKREIQITAILRLLFPDRLIPASLDVDGLDGLPPRLAAGANVVTSIIPPGQGLAGVAQSTLDIDESRRTTAWVLPVLEENGLQAGSRDGYRSWIEKRVQGLVGSEN
ncbi:MAG: methylornithine synthase PylB [Desulfohalobiaceae bacterium]|nr:methylornithine synthase PylB [Desulfohalobiaceae bacterium]